MSVYYIDKLLLYNQFVQIVKYEQIVHYKYCLYKQ